MCKSRSHAADNGERTEWMQEGNVFVECMSVPRWRALSSICVSDLVGSPSTNKSCSSCFVNRLSKALPYIRTKWKIHSEHISWQCFLVTSGLWCTALRKLFESYKPTITSSILGLNSNLRCTTFVRITYAATMLPLLPPFGLYYSYYCLLVAVVLNVWRNSRTVLLIYCTVYCTRMYAHHRQHSSHLPLTYWQGWQTSSYLQPGWRTLHNQRTCCETLV